MGSIIALTDGNGVVTTSYTYDAFGNVTVSGNDVNSFQYTGRENDGTGLYYYRARYYSPGMRRFISEDPIRLAGGMNYFAYVQSNPLTYVDPLGYRCWHLLAFGAYSFLEGEAFFVTGVFTPIAMGMTLSPLAGAAFGLTASPAFIMAGIYEFQAAGHDFDEFRKCRKRERDNSNDPNDPDNPNGPANPNGPNVPKNPSNRNDKKVNQNGCK